MKIQTAILILVMLLVLCACGTGNTAGQVPDTAPVTVTAEPEHTFPGGHYPDASSPAEESEDSAVPSEGPDQVPSVEVDVPGEEGIPAVFSPDFTFSTTDRDGNEYDETVFSGYKLTIVNFWEPWCGPCVREMPELQKLYENYSGSGLNIIGVYSTPGMEEDVRSVLLSSGVTFPILHYTNDFDQFQTTFVPTTILVDGSGHVVSEEPIVGSNSYEGWEALIREYLS